MTSGPASDGMVQISDDKLLFPRVEEKSGIYRFTLRSAEGQSVLIGETDRLRRRFAQYRNPGPSQRTNQRINSRMRDIIRADGSVDVVTATEVRLDIDGDPAIADLEFHPYRLLAENAALVVALQLGHVVENL
jgi:hypothetical protein